MISDGVFASLRVCCVQKRNEEIKNVYKRAPIYHVKVNFNSSAYKTL